MDRAFSPQMSRRSLLGSVALGGTLAATSGAQARIQRQGNVARHDCVVVGAGVFGAWTAEFLRRAGKRVLLLDAWGPGHTTSSSGGESRLIRTEYLGNRLYTGMAWESLAQWKALSADAGLPIFVESGALYLYRHEADDVAQSLVLHRAMDIPVERVEKASLVKRFPQFGLDDIAYGVFQPTMGALMARRSLQFLVERFVAGGGTYRQAAVAVPVLDPQHDGLVLSDGTRVHADQYIFAGGAWLPKLFPQAVGARIKPTRQEVFFFEPEAGDTRFLPDRMPAWVDAHEEDLHYGFPMLENRGAKIALDRHGPRADPDTIVRQVTSEGEAAVRVYLQKRFPALADKRLSETRVCQYENSDNGNFLIDTHPEWSRVMIVGGGTGHGFKHGPAVGRYVTERLYEARSAEAVFGFAAHGVHHVAASASQDVAVLHERLKAELRTMLDHGVPGVSAAIVSGGDLVFSAAEGYADIASQTGLQPEYTMCIGSVTKTFVATLVLQLAGEGHLDLDAPVTRYLGAETCPGDGRAGVSVRSLLTHSSGIASWEENSAWIHEARGDRITKGRHWGKRDILDYVPRALNAGPGHFHYSNTNFTLLGLICEAVTGRKLATLVRDRIGGPLDLTSLSLAGFELPAAKASSRYHFATPAFQRKAGVSQHFVPVAGDLVDVGEASLAPEWAAGGLQCSASDLARFGASLQAGKLCPVKQYNQMQDWMQLEPERSVGLGLFRIETPAGAMVGHSGNVLGSSAALFWTEEADTVISLMHNGGVIHADKDTTSAMHMVLTPGFLNAALVLGHATKTRQG